MNKRYSLILLGVVTLLFAVTVGGRVPYFLLYFYGALLFLPLIHCLLGKRWIMGQLQFPMVEVMAGEEIKIKYSIVNGLPIYFPWLELDNQIAYRLTGKREDKIIFPLAPKDLIKGETVAVCRRRGLYEIGTMQLTIKDPMSIYSVSKRINEPMQLKIFPQITTLNHFKIKASQQIGDLRVRDPLFQDISNISDIRQYQQGDSIKKIHWGVSAKSNELMVKNYEQSGDTQIVLLIDSFARNYSDDKEGWIEDKLVETAASIIDFCLKRNLSTVLFNVDEKSSRVVKGDNPQFLKKFMNELVIFHPKGALELEKQVGQATLNVQQGMTLLLLTPILSKDTGTQGIYLKRKNLNPVFIVVGDSSQEEEWKDNKSIGKKLELEGILVYYIDLKQDIRDALEGKYGKGA